MMVAWISLPEKTASAAGYMCGGMTPVRVGFFLAAVCRIVIVPGAMWLLAISITMESWTWPQPETSELKSGPAMDTERGRRLPQVSRQPEIISVLQLAIWITMDGWIWWLLVQTVPASNPGKTSAALGQY